MPFQNVIQFDCGCLGLDVQRGDGDYLILAVCDESANGLTWKAMHDKTFKPAEAGKALAAIHEVMRQAHQGRKLDEIQSLLEVK